jgi:hypothetical protein
VQSERPATKLTSTSLSFAIANHWPESRTPRRKKKREQEAIYLHTQPTGHWCRQSRQRMRPLQKENSPSFTPDGRAEKA